MWSLPRRWSCSGRGWTHPRHDWKISNPFGNETPGVPEERISNPFGNATPGVPEERVTHLPFGSSHFFRKREVRAISPMGIMSDVDTSSGHNCWTPTLYLTMPLDQDDARTTAATRREILASIAELLERLRSLDVADESAATSARSSAIRVGSRVKIIIRGKWHGRVGQIISPHGTQFWNIRLDRLEGEPMSFIIHKKTSSLELLD